MEQTTNKKPIYILASILLGGYSLWSWFFKVGLYALLIRLLARSFDIYQPFFTGLAMVIVLTLLPLIFLLRAKKGRHEYQLKYPELERRLKKRTRTIALSFAFFVGLSAGAYFLSTKAPAEDSLAIEIDLNSYQSKSLWFKKVSVKGVALTKSATVTQETSTLGDTYYARYTPIVAQLNSDRPVYFIEAFTSDSIEAVSRSKVSTSGYVMPIALPVPIRDSIEKDGVILASRTYLISDRFFSAKKLAFIVSVLLGFIALVLFLLLATARNHNKRKLRLCKEHQGNW